MSGLTPLAKEIVEAVRAMTRADTEADVPAFFAASVMLMSARGYTLEELSALALEAANGRDVLPNILRFIEVYKP